MHIVLSSAYNAPIQYYTKFLLGYPVIIEQNDTYIKQTYRNRCIINTSEGTMSLSVPVVYSAKERTKTKDVIISEHDNWQHTHWNAIISAYNSSPFFEYYKDDFEQFYTNKFMSLVEYNDKLLRLTLSLLKMEDASFSYSSEYVEDADILDYRESINPKKGYKDDALFKPARYYQLFTDRQAFNENMSILDLLFNMGNESLLVLLDSIPEGVRR